jgi:hypothetical protein
MAIEIGGVLFQGMPGLDKDNLSKLDHVGRVLWLKYRFDTFFIDPFRKFVALDGQGTYIWLCAVNLLCTAVEALASFELNLGRGNGMQEFAQFVEGHFPAFGAVPFELDEPALKGNPARRPAEHLYRYFRNGLAHGFCIEWGGLLHREDGAPDYLSTRNPLGTLKSLVIAPRDLIAEFEIAICDFFSKAASWPIGSSEYACFNERFESVFMICSATASTP